MILKDFVGLIFPVTCANCRDPLVSGEDLLCTKCRIDLPRTDETSLKALESRFISLNNLVLVRSFLKFTKKGSAQRLLHQLKYEKQKEIGITLGHLFGAELKDELIALHFDMIVPVPLHHSKLRSRGYNQSDLIAQGMSEASGIDWNPTFLKRTRKTSTQTKKGKIERWQNVDQIFDVSDNKSVENKNVVLVDDVVTTGATLHAALDTLNDAGCKTLGVVTLAQADL